MQKSQRPPRYFLMASLIFFPLLGTCALIEALINGSLLARLLLFTEVILAMAAIACAIYIYRDG